MAFLILPRSDDVMTMGFNTLRVNMIIEIELGELSALPHSTARADTINSVRRCLDGANRLIS